jgi:hypothetical protein
MLSKFAFRAISSNDDTSILCLWITSIWNPFESPGVGRGGGGGRFVIVPIVLTDFALVNVAVIFLFQKNMIRIRKILPLLAVSRGIGGDGQHF